MLIIASGATIPQPSDWPQGPPWNPAQLYVNDVFFDWASLGHRRDSYSPGYKVAQLDESLLTNASRADDLIDRWSRQDIFGLGPYYFLPGPPLALWQRAGWVQAPQTYTPNPALDVQIPLPQSTERGNFEQNLQAILTNLNNLATNTSDTIPLLNSDKQELARDLRNVVLLMARLLLPDRADIQGA